MRLAGLAAGLIGVACLLGLALRSASQEAAQPEPPMSQPSSPPGPSLSVAALVPWGDSIPGDPVIVDRTGTSAFAVGPQRYPARPHLELAAGPLGVWGRAVRGDGVALPVAVSIQDAGARTVPLRAGPLALAPAAEAGVWALEPDAIRRYGPDGDVRAEAPRDAAVTLVGREDGGVWAVAGSSAWSLNADGSPLSAPHAWSGSPGGVARGNQLCALERAAPRPLTCLSDGGRVDSTPLASAPGPFERLLGVAADGTAVTEAGDRIVFYGSDGSLHETALANAGLSPGGEPFVSWRTPEAVHLRVGSSDAERALPVPPGVMPGFFAAVALADDGGVLAYGLGKAASYDGDGGLARSFAVADQATYTADVFATAWLLAQPGGRAWSDGAILLSTSGPAGLAVIRARPTP